MATTVNNTTVQSRITIIFDAGGSLTGDGPAKGTGNTESDVYLDDKVYLNIRSHTEIDASIHAMQWDAGTNSGTLEYTDNRDNLDVSSFPQWATNVVIRCEAQDTWQTTYDGHADANAEDDSAAVTAANTARDNYLSAHSITY
tara:strand:+ start:1348 stop:1776 length:429 start_codon:yes stop_codon:yes gene_type:complete